MHVFSHFNIIGVIMLITGNSLNELRKSVSLTSAFDHTAKPPIIDPLNYIISPQRLLLMRRIAIIIAAGIHKL